jgi:hypothetical protein
MQFSEDRVYAVEGQRSNSYEYWFEKMKIHKLASRSERKGVLGVFECFPGKCKLGPCPFQLTIVGDDDEVHF